MSCLANIYWSGLSQEWPCHSDTMSWFGSHTVYKYYILVRNLELLLESEKKIENVGEQRCGCIHSWYWVDCTLASELGEVVQDTVYMSYSFCSHIHI